MPPNPNVGYIAEDVGEEINDGTAMWVTFSQQVVREKPVATRSGDRCGRNREVAQTTASCAATTRHQ